MTEIARDLVSRLDTISISTATTCGTTTTTQGYTTEVLHATLTNLVRKELEQMKQRQRENLGAVSTDVEVLVGGATSASANSLLRSQLEQRLTKLENLIGGVNAAGASSSMGIMKRLEEAETVLQHVDKNDVELVSSRAKLIRYL